MQIDQVNQSEQAISRRGFIKGAAVSALAAAAIGAGQVALDKATDPAAVNLVTSAPIGPVAVTTAVPSSTGSVERLVADLANVQAENVRLQTALAAAQQQLEILQAGEHSQTIQSEALTVELNSANERLGIMAGLLALYNQLDDVPLDVLFEHGITAVSEGLGSLLDEIPTLEQGLQQGEVALSTFEGQIPLLQNGRSWLNHHVDKLQVYFTAVEKLLEKTVDRIGPILEMINDWFASVRRWLPFNLGQRATEIMESMTTLILETPQTISGLTTNVVEPLNIWIDDSQEETPVQRQLVNPLKREVIAKGFNSVLKTRDLSTLYHSELKIPIETAVSQRRQIQNLIQDYRQENQL